MRGQVAALGVVLVAFACAQNPHAAEAKTDCSREAGDGAGQPGPRIRPTKLTPDVAANVVNFGGDRGVQEVDVVLNANPALPQSVRPEQIRFEVPHRFSRVADKLRTTSAPRPTFSEPRISAGRSRVTFTMCLDGEGLDAGSYAGSVLVEGPPGLAPASVSVTENAKNFWLALGGGIGVLLLASVFLVLRGAAARQVKTAEKLATEVVAAKTEGGLSAALDKQDKHQPKSVWKYIGGVFKDLNWWVTSVVALALAAASIYGLYSADPSWGADTVGSVIALVGPAFTAVGVQSVVTSLGRTVAR